MHEWGVFIQAPDNSLEQVYENSAPIDNYVDNNITTEIESAYTIIGTDTFEAA